VRVTDELLSEIDALSKKSGSSRSDTLRGLIIIGLNRLRPGRKPE
jgi:metal-responsive CopG/Arc/MetJ family transcriptional regulator